MNVVIYARYSSHNQTEQSIEGQLYVCYEFARKNNYTIINEYIDRATTGTNDNREQFQKMIEDSSKKQFQGVLVYQLDRFARNRYDSSHYKHKLKQNGVRVFSARENISEDASGILMESVLEGMAEYYSVELSQKVKRGMQINATKCYYNGGSVPLGFKLITVEELNGPMGKKICKKQFAIDEGTAPIVQKIFEMYSTGSTMADIIRYLNERQLKTSRGNEFNKNSLRKMLLNKKYIGIYSYDNKEVKGGIPSIIEEDLFYKVREKMLKNKEAPQRARAKTNYLLTTKLFCGNCKSMMVGYSGTSKTGKLHCYYGCKGTWQHKCNRKGVRKEYIEDFVVTHARKILTDEKINEIANSIIEVAKKEKNSIRLKELQKQLRANEKQKVNLFNSLKICDMNDVRKSIFEEISKMEQQKKLLEEQIAVERASSYNVTLSQIKFFLRNLANGNLDDIRNRQMLINVLIYKVVIYEKSITIVFTTQDKYYEERIPTISEMESSFVGNLFPPEQKEKLEFSIKLWYKYIEWCSRNFRSLESFFF